MVFCESKLAQKSALEQKKSDVLDGDEMLELRGEVENVEMSERDHDDDEGDEKLVCCGCLHSTRGHSRGPGDH